MLAFFAFPLLTGASSAHAQTEPVYIKSGFLTGNSYRASSAQEKSGFVMGFIDGLLVAPLLGAPRSKLVRLEECLTGMVNSQVVAIVDKWLTENPGRWHQQMNVLTFSALQAACEK